MCMLTFRGVFDCLGSFGFGFRVFLDPLPCSTFETSFWTTHGMSWILEQEAQVPNQRPYTLGSKSNSPKPSR